MSTDLDVIAQPRSVVQLSNDQLKFIASSEFVPRGLRGNLPAIMACVSTGRALGLDDMAALRSIHVIDGKATFSAELMVMLTRKQGHSITGEVKEGRAIVRGKRADNGDEIIVEWTLEMAQRAGLVNKDNWKKYPEAMLWARGVSMLCRMLFADVFAGNAMTTEEVIDGDVIDAEPLPEPKRTNNNKATTAQHKKLHALIKELKEKESEVDWEQKSKALAKELFGKESRADLTVTEMGELIEVLPTADVPF